MTERPAFFFFAEGWLFHLSPSVLVAFFRITDTERRHCLLS
jgi:hypothetical protein